VRCLPHGFVSAHPIGSALNLTLASKCLYISDLRLVLSMHMIRRG